MKVPTAAVSGMTTRTVLTLVKRGANRLRRTVMPTVAVDVRLG